MARQPRRFSALQERHHESKPDLSCGFGVNDVTGRSLAQRAHGLRPSATSWPLRWFGTVSQARGRRIELAESSAVPLPSVRGEELFVRP